MKRWTPEEIETLRIRFERGDKTEHIAGDLGVSRSAAFAQAQFRGFKRDARVMRTPRPVPPSSAERFAALRANLRADLDAEGLYRFDDPRHALFGAS